MDQSLYILLYIITVISTHFFLIQDVILYIPKHIYGWEALKLLSWDHLPIYQSEVIMSTMASQINGVSIVYSTVCSGVDQRKHQSPASLTFVRGIHRRSVNSRHTERASDSENVPIWWHHHVSAVNPNVNFQGIAKAKECQCKTYQLFTWYMCTWHIKTCERWVALCEQYFQMHFLDWKLFGFCIEFADCS